MKKSLFLLLTLILTMSVYAQSNNEAFYYKNIENDKDLNLSASQIAKIKKLNTEIGPQFATIGKDKSLSGYEKGQKKQALALRHKSEIQKILTPAQISTWEKKYGKMEDGKGIKDSMTDNIDTKLKTLEKKYDADKNMIDNDNALSKDQKKAKKEALKESYKTEKQKLKNQKDTVKKTVLFKD